MVSVRPLFDRPCIAERPFRTHGNVLKSPSDRSYGIMYHERIFFVDTISSLESMSKAEAILKSVSSDGCILLRHHFETVPGVTPTLSASHRLERCASANAPFTLFMVFVFFKMVL